jgi:hypothetical protein
MSCGALVRPPRTQCGNPGSAPDRRSTAARAVGPTPGSPPRRGQVGVAIGLVAVVPLQELLVFALQILFEDDAPDVEAAVLVSEACLLLAVRRAEIRVVVDFAWAADAGVKRLRDFVLVLEEVRVEQLRPSFVRTTPRSSSPRLTVSTSPSSVAGRAPRGACRATAHRIACSRGAPRYQHAIRPAPAARHPRARQTLPIQLIHLTKLMLPVYSSQRLSRSHRSRLPRP